MRIPLLVSLLVAAQGVSAQVHQGAPIPYSGAYYSSPQPQVIYVAPPAPTMYYYAPYYTPYATPYYPSFARYYPPMYYGASWWYGAAWSPWYYPYAYHGYGWYRPAFYGGFAVGRWGVAGHVRFSGGWGFRRR